MKTTVLLQAPLDFSTKWILAGCAMLVAAVALLLALRVLPGRALRRPAAPSPRAIRLSLLKALALKRLRRLEADFRSGRIDSRTVHQGMSREVRAFAQAVTGAPMTHMTHAQLRSLPYSGLERLIGALYEPEFSPLPDAEIAGAIQRCKELIEQWP